MVKKTLNTNRKSLTTYIAGKPCAVSHLAPRKYKIGVITRFCQFGNHEFQQFYGFGAYICTLRYYMVGLCRSKACTIESRLLAIRNGERRLS